MIQNSESQRMKRRFMYSTITALLLQITGVVCGFILPRLILTEYGSEVNGLVQSITRFLSIISFLELGIGSVIQASLYKPLAEKNNEELSKVVTSGTKYFVNIARILLVYVVFLIIVFPYMGGNSFGWVYTGTLIVAISISFFAQYYFGILDRIILNADQRGYIHFTAQIVTLITNTVLCVILIRIHSSIQMVKLVSSLVFVARPLVIHYYVQRKYQINRKATYEEEPIKQKWNGASIQISSTVLDEADTVVLTSLSTLQNVSIYSVYHLVVTGVKQLLLSSTSGINSIFGNLWAKGNVKKLSEVFGAVEWGIHVLAVFVFTCTGLLILPFISVYTDGITDANYIQPVFAFIIVTATGVQCLRIPYNMLVTSCGHFKETQKSYIIAALINIISSCLLVYLLGLIGVAVGTLLAMLYQTLWLQVYVSKNLIKWPIRNILKQIVYDLICVITIIITTRWIDYSVSSYMNWFVLSIKIAAIALFDIAVLSITLSRKQIKLLKHYFLKNK